MFWGWLSDDEALFRSATQVRPWNAGLVETVEIYRKPHTRYMAALRCVEDIHVIYIALGGPRVFRAALPMWHALPCRCRWWGCPEAGLRCGARKNPVRGLLTYLDISWHINSKEVSTTFQCSRRAWTMNVFDRIDRMCRHYQWSDLVTWRYLCYGRFWSQKIDIFGWSQDSQDEFSLFCLPRSVPEAFCSPDFCTAGQNSWAFWLLAIFLAVSCRQDQKDLSPNGYLHVAFRWAQTISDLANCGFAKVPKQLQTCFTKCILCSQNIMRRFRHACKGCMCLHV